MKWGRKATGGPRRTGRVRRRPAWLAELDALRADELSRPAAPLTDRAALQARKWTLLHDGICAHPFTVGTHLPRHEQWLTTRALVRELGIDEPELIDWMAQQAEIHRHLALGIPDLRPRKDGPCHAVLVDHLAKRRFKALAVYRWHLAADADGGPAGYGEPTAAGRDQ